MKEGTLANIALDNLVIAGDIVSAHGDDGGMLNLAAFHLQQCAEFYLKDFLERNGVEYDDTHTIEILLVQCRENEVFPDGYEYLNEKSEMLSSWYSKTRYLKEYFVEKEKVSLAISGLEKNIAPKLTERTAV